ncbi:hypothetical protein KIN20_004146 [Parelaphostrongylus tenuis]|uniref:Uncharacterized protein n=1 Tax=Parelaphostrongylus tenuis TaxID=148309 RepID=A0AAD5QGP3_PARTN|nr:hypothetical protein KIN20_004146 [Parelaphostrongylus tenuis]
MELSKERKRLLMLYEYKFGSTGAHAADSQKDQGKIEELDGVEILPYPLYGTDVAPFDYVPI